MEKRSVCISEWKIGEIFFGTIIRANRQLHLESMPRVLCDTPTGLRSTDGDIASIYAAFTLSQKLTT
jgi:hypothetical protein